MNRNTEQQPESRLLPWTMAVSGLAVLGTVVADIWVDLDYRIAANVSLVYIAVLTTVFTVLYLVRSRWWTNRIGRVYLAKSVVMSLVLLQIVVAVWLDTDYPGRQHIRFVIYTLGAAVYLPMLISLWREQQRDRRRRTPSGDHDDLV